VHTQGKVAVFVKVEEAIVVEEGEEEAEGGEVGGVEWEEGG
jgi:hypothetical protein